MEAQQSAAPKRFASPFELQQLQRDQDHLLKALQSKEIQNKEDVGSAMRRQTRVREKVEPPDLTPAQRDRAKKTIDRLEAEISEGMLSSQEMRRAPPEARDINLAWHRRNRHKVTRWRNMIRALHKGEDRTHVEYLTNIERLRPRQSHLGMHAARVGGNTLFSEPSELFKANYDDIDWTEPAKTPKQELESQFDELPEDEQERLTQPEE